MTAQVLRTSPPAGSADCDAGAEHARRLEALRRRMHRDGLAAVALAGPENIYYLTGLDHLGYFAFTMLVVSPTGRPTLITRAMERPTIRAHVPWCAHVMFDDGQSAAAAVTSVLDDIVTDGAVVALDEDSMFFPPAVAAEIRARLPHACWCSASRLLVHQRAVKSDTEIAAMRCAAGLSDAAFAAGLAAAQPGTPECRVAAEVYRTMIGRGGQPPGFPPLIRPTTLLDQEHVTWNDRRIEQGRGVFFELSASVRRYHAPLSRTVPLGPPSPEMQDAAETARAGLAAARDALRPGTTSGEVYAAWERAVDGAERRSPLRHHCGYLVGIGFPPSWVGGGAVPGIRPGGELVIRAGMTFHLMSWVQQPVPHVLSDTALVTETGTEMLTTAPHAPNAAG